MRFGISIGGLLVLAFVYWLGSQNVFGKIVAAVRGGAA